MTLVVTYTGGFLGCFTVEPDGSMRQRALIDTGSDTPSPQELAETGKVLADQYGWKLNGSPAPMTVAPLKKAIPRKSKPAKRNRRYPPLEEKRALVIGYLREHGPSTVRELLEGIGQPTDDRSIGNWYHTLKSMVADGSLDFTTREKLPHEYQAPRVYFLKGE